MANIRIDYNGELMDGQSLTFQAPCDCSAIEGLSVYYPSGGNGKLNKHFIMKDAHGNTLTGLGNLFAKGAYVKVIIDTTNNFAYLQNAATNKYLETRIPTIRTGTSAPSNSLGADGDIYIQIV